MVTHGLTFLQIAIALMLLRSAVLKCMDIRAFSEGIEDYEILPPSTIPFFARALVLTELILGTSHLVIGPPAAFLYVTLTLFLIFFFVIAYVIVRGYEVDCLCFGATHTSRVTNWTLARVGLLVLIEAVLVVGPFQSVGANPADLRMYIFFLSGGALFFTLARWIGNITLFIDMRRLCSACGRGDA